MGLWLGAAAPVCAQDLRRVRRTIEYLASPRLHGRGYVRGGDTQAARFLAKRFQQIGLTPLAPGFQQPFLLTVNTFPDRMHLRIDGKALRPGLDFIAEPESGGGSVQGLITTLDTLIFTDEAAGQRFLQQPLQHRVLILRQRDADRLRTLPAAFAQHIAEAAARITLVPVKLTASLADHQQPQPQFLVLASSWPQQGAQQATIEVTAALTANYQTHNVAGFLRGTAQPDSFLVVTAHYDHLGHMGRRTYFPGANDNASGTAMLLELAEYYAKPENRLAYSIAFVAFGGEEAGLLGSRYFVQHPLLPLERIRFLLNLDLEGTGQDGATVVNGRIHERAYQQLVTLNEAGRFLPGLASRGRAANSDHYPFSEAGVPAFFLYLRGQPTFYHDVLDRSATLPLSGFGGLFKLLVGFMQLQGANASQAKTP
ncbi:M28 family metallopeptidase [Hymenobacter busanensis]|uniref:M28 family metallopeptidase n=1 Tax=Hymenobacter busanensis TaxID=2607656 RepID=UPI00136772F1|nr:M28 family peptidase [Hymenobacter busanensis]QHJ07808.1 M28 family peptidase [Hymenobacter busanensis]